MDEDDFYLQIAHALSGCQLVEQELKVYITEALELAKKRIGDKMPFKMSGADYEKLPLGRLMAVFEKLTDNDTLVADLKMFAETRNYLSHEGITHCLDYEGELSRSTALKFKDKLKTIQQEARRLQAALHDEANKFRGHLMFEDLTQDADS